MSAVIGFIIITIFLFTNILPCSFSKVAAAEPTPLQQSVQLALKNHPKLQAIKYNNQAVKYDLEQARGAYLPSVDLRLGQGWEEYSSEITRMDGADPDNNDWQSRSDATIRLVQKIYDGGETSSQVSITKAQLDSTNCQVKAAAQAIALNAIDAHLSVLRQRRLVELSEKNLKFHQDMKDALSERALAGAGSIADVHKVQARLAIAASTLYQRKTELRHAIDNYIRITGSEPGELASAKVPGNLPKTLDQALQNMENGNPELMILDAAIKEAESRLELARSSYKPKIDLELSRMYNYHIEGDRSWRNANTAMLFLHWNLYRGGQDMAGVDAAAFRAYQSRSNRRDKLLELKKAMSAAWEDYKSLCMQESSYRDAVTYSRKTLDAYWKQFNVSKRDILDVLSAEHDCFQSNSQLTTVSINKIIAAYRILKIEGTLRLR